MIPNQDPVAIGVIPQSINTLSSSLFVCTNNFCSPLVNNFNKTTYIFIDYDVLNLGPSFFVANIDLLNLNMWVMTNDSSITG